MNPKRSRREHAANALGALSLAISDRVNAAIEPIAGLGPSAPAALAALQQFLNGGSITSLSAVLDLTHSGTVRLVDRLAAAGLVERVGADDGRAVSVVLTPSGESLAARIHAAREATLTRALSALSADELDRLTGLLDHMLATTALARLEEREARPHDRHAPWMCRLCDFAACRRSQGKCPVNNAVRAGHPPGH